MNYTYAYYQEASSLATSTIWARDRGQTRKNTGDVRWICAVSNVRTQVLCDRDLEEGGRRTDHNNPRDYLNFKLLLL